MFEQLALCATAHIANYLCLIIHNVPGLESDMGKPPRPSVQGSPELTSMTLMSPKPEPPNISTRNGGIL